MKNRKLDSLILLRAIAVIAVCLCHYSHPLESKSTIGSIFTVFHDYGKYGVNIFFVVSGFVIPLSLKASNYSVREYFRFLWKRALRLHPPYLVALGLTLLLSYFSHRTRHLVFPETIDSVIKSFFYLHFPSENPVFWTLAVEAQYYIFIGIAYIFISNEPKKSIIFLVPIAIVLNQFHVGQYVSYFSYFSYFLVGIIGFLLYTRQGSSSLNIIGIFALILYTAIFDELPGSIAALFAISFILWYYKSVSPAVSFIGEISYSIYLIHFPVGIKFINLVSRYISPSYNWALFLLALSFILILSWLFYKFIEKPFATYSSKIKYRPTLTPVSSVE